MSSNNQELQMDKKKRFWAIFKLILLLIILIGVPTYLYLNYGEEIFSDHFVNDIISYVQAHKNMAGLTLVGLQVLQVIICIIPGQPIQFAASYLFGILGGYLLSIIGAVIGAFISFYIARILGRDFVRLFVDDDKIEYYYNKLNSGKGFMLVFLIYLIPGVPKDIVSYIAGITDMKIRPFLLLSSIGRTPGMVGSLLFGHFFNIGNYTAIAILAVLTVVILIVFLIKRKSIMAFMDRLEKAERDRDIRKSAVRK